MTLLDTQHLASFEVDFAWHFLGEGPEIWTAYGLLCGYDSAVIRRTEVLDQTITLAVTPLSALVKSHES